MIRRLRGATVARSRVYRSGLPWYAVAYIATIILANWSIRAFGVVPVGFGLFAPAGVYWVGLTFTLRDLTQERLGRRATVIAVLIGALVSALVSPQLALASVGAFLVSELLDMAVYTPLRARSWLLAVAASNTVGLVVDSILFLSLAFGSLQYLAGQVVGKAEMTILAVAVLAVTRSKLTVR